MKEVIKVYEGVMKVYEIVYENNYERLYRGYERL